MVDDEDQKVMIGVVILGVMIENGLKEVKNGTNTEEMIDVIMIVEMITAHVVALREEIDELTEETVQLGRILNKERVQLEKK